MKASERQVGGNHYNAGSVGHWDYIVVINAPYLEGCASKYLVRWRKKGGVQDLEKAAHYIERRLEAVQQYQGVIKGARKSEKLFNMFLVENMVPRRESEIIDLILHWTNTEDLRTALKEIRDMITKEGEACGPTSAYVNQG